MVIHIGRSVMLKGFIFFKTGKIPFVINNYRMELFTDDILLNDFCKEYNSKNNYLLNGQCFDTGISGRIAVFLVEYSLGTTCYLRCYTISMLTKDEHFRFDTIGLQSSFLDDIFRYKYNYLDLVQSGYNLAIQPIDVYRIPFDMNDLHYEFTFRIGLDTRLGLLENFDKKGELILPLHTKQIQECYNITQVFYRLAMFMTSLATYPLSKLPFTIKAQKLAGFIAPFAQKIYYLDMTYTFMILTS